MGVCAEVKKALVDQTLENLSEGLALCIKINSIGIARA